MSEETPQLGVPARLARQALERHAACERDPKPAEVVAFGRDHLERRARVSREPLPVEHIQRGEG